MSEELKPCPFCGGEAGKGVSGWIACSSARCPAYNFVGTESEWNTRTHPAPAEQVEVVATVEAYGGKWCAIHWGRTLGETEDPERQLMTVAQHNRIMAATVPAGCKVVPVELLQRVIDYYCEGDGELKCIAQDCRAILEAKDE